MKKFIWLTFLAGNLYAAGPIYQHKDNEIQREIQELYKTLDQVTGNDSVGNIIGEIKIYSGDTAPTGWFICDGSSVSRTTYAALFAVIGERFGQGDNTTTFTLPDFRGRFLRGRDGSAGRDPNDTTRTAMATGGATGDNVGSIQGQMTKLPTSAFTTSDPGDHSHTYQCSGIGTAANNVPEKSDGNNTIYTNETDNDGGAHTHTIGGGDVETRPINIYVNYIIRY